MREEEKVEKKDDKVHQPRGYHQHTGSIRTSLYLCFALQRLVTCRRV